MAIDARSPFSLQAGITAKIEALLRGPERGILILGTLFLIIFLSSLIAETSKSTIFAEIGIITGLGGLVSILIYWLFWGHSYQTEGPLTTIVASGKELSITAPTYGQKELISLLREVIQNRQSLPPPYGAVTNGKPQEQEGLSKYSEEKKDQISKEFYEKIKQHDQQVFSQLKEIEGKLSVSEEIELPVQNEIKEETGTDS